MFLYACVIIACLYALVLMRMCYLRRLLNLRVRYRRGYVYGFTDWGQVLPVIKIGRAKDPVQRLRAHKCAAPFGLLTYFVLRVPDEHKAERALHGLYSRWRVRKNGEWFWLTPVLMLDMVLLRIMK